MPTTAEQIASVLVEFHTQLPPTSRVHVDVSRMAAALLSARATIARLEASNRDLEAAVHTYRKSADAAKETIARLEGELIAEKRAHEEKSQRMTADLAVAKREVASLTEIARCETEFAMAARTRADAAERRVEAVTGAAAEEAAYQVMVKEYGGRVLFSRLSIRLALEAALAAASGDTATTEGGR